MEKSERFNQWKLRRVKNEYKFGGKDCYTCEGGFNNDQELGLCKITLKHVYLPLEADKYLCLRCMKKIGVKELELEVIRKELQKERNLLVLSDLFHLFKCMPDITEVHENSRECLRIHNLGKAIPPNLARETLSIFLVFHNDKELRDLYIGLCNTGHELADVFSCMGGVWPTLQQRREAKKALEKQKNN